MIWILDFRFWILRKVWGVDSLPPKRILDRFWILVGL